MEEETGKIKSETEKGTEKIVENFKKAEEQTTKIMEMIENMKKCCDSNAQFVNNDISKPL